MGTQEEKNLAILKKINEAIFAGNMEEAKRYLDPEMMIDEPASLPYGGFYRGPGGFERLVNTVFYKTWDDVDVKVEGYTAGGDCVVILLHFSAKGKKTGKTFSMPMAELWRFRDGKAIELRPFYYDTKRACEVFGD